MKVHAHAANVSTAWGLKERRNSSVDHTPPSANSSIGVAIVEDSALLTDLIVEAVDDAREMHVIGTAGSCREALETIDWSEVSFGVLDLHLPDGLGLVMGRRIRERYPLIRMAILSDHRRPALLSELSSDELPFWSYILKSSIDGRAHLGEILRMAASGSYIDPNTTLGSSRVEEAINGLSDQQRKILGLVARGLSNATIAKQLFLSEKSIEYNLSQIYQALDLTGDSALNQRVAAAVLYLRRFAPDTHI